MRAAEHRHGDNTAQHDHPGGRGHRRPGAPPEIVPPPGPGRDGRSRESGPAERARVIHHAGPVRAPGRRAVGAGRQDLAPELAGQGDLRHRAARSQGSGGRGSGGRGGGNAGVRVSGSEPAQALVPGHRVQPGPEPVGIGQLRQLRGSDDEGVLYGLGRAAHRIRVGQHEPAVGVQWRRVAVVRLGEPVRVTCGDRGDQLAVLHAPTVVGWRIAGSRNR